MKTSSKKITLQFAINQINKYIEPNEYKGIKLKRQTCFHLKMPNPLFTVALKNVKLSDILIQKELSPKTNTLQKFQVFFISVKA